MRRSANARDRSDPHPSGLVGTPAKADSAERSSTMDDILSIAGASTLPSPERQMTEAKMIMKAIVLTDQAAGTAGMELVNRAKPQPAIHDVVVQVHASRSVPS